MPSSTAPMRAYERLRGTPPWAVDAVIATLVVLTGLLATAPSGPDASDYRERDALAFVLVLAATIPYYLRRRAPLTVLIVATSALAALMLLDYFPGALPFTVLVGAYTVDAERAARGTAGGAAFLAAVLVVLALGDTPSFGIGELIVSAAAFGAAMLVGRGMQSRSARIDAFAGQQAEAALRAAADERLRIAQEIHDVVAHSLGVIAVQAGVGLHVLDTDPGEARRALEHVSRSSRSSLAEIRRMLGLIRDTDGAPTYTPAPGLADIPRLAEEVTSAGLYVDVAMAGDTDEVPAGVGLAAYRIVQEALTNALRHAGARRATVRLSNASGSLAIEVTDDGRGPDGRASGGHGLVGMRERVAVYGGSLETGAGEHGGFRVAARLPYDAEPGA